VTTQLDERVVLERLLIGIAGGRRVKAPARR
jgi:hypothetical protein